MTSVDDSQGANTGLVTPPDGPLVDRLGALRALANDLATASRSANTNRAYEGDWKSFAAWTVAHDVDSLPAVPETVALYLASLVASGRRTGTIHRALVAISQRHLDAGHPSPRNDGRVRMVVRGVRRRLGTDQERKAALTPEEVAAMIAALPGDLRGIRDRAILALGFGGGFRRSELVGLNVEDVAFREGGLVVKLRRSKTDADGVGRRVRVGGSSAAESVAIWLQKSQLETGALFRAVTAGARVGVSALQDAAVARLIKRAAATVGLDVKRFSGHSLRSGFATAAAREGRSEREIQRTLGHASLAMTLRYINDADESLG